jgi:hypothetical protein
MPACVIFNGGPCSPKDATFPFQITVTRNNPQPSTLCLASGDSQLVTLGPGTYRVFDQSAFGFAAIFLGDCIQILDINEHTATGTISAGKHKTCTITNLMEAFSLHL